MCGNSPVSAHCTTSDTQVRKDFVSFCIQNGNINIFLLLLHNHGTASRREERIETYTNGVWCEALTIKNINGKKVVIFILMILRLVYNKYGESILLRYLGIKVQISLSYAIQSCELRQNWQCQEWFF